MSSGFRRPVASSVPAPKSMRTVRPPSSRMTFCALMSRWTRPRPWTAASAWQRSTPMGVASSALSGPRARSSSSIVRPLMYSIHRPTNSFDRSTPWTTTTLRWRTLARSEPSRSTRLESAAEFSGVTGKSLSATSRLERVAGAIDLGESALADRFEHGQRCPTSRAAALGATSCCTSVWRGSRGGSRPTASGSR